MGRGEILLLPLTILSVFRNPSCFRILLFLSLRILLFQNPSSPFFLSKSSSFLSLEIFLLLLLSIPLSLSSWLKSTSSSLAATRAQAGFASRTRQPYGVVWRGVVVGSRGVQKRFKDVGCLLYHRTSPGRDC